MKMRRKTAHLVTALAVLMASIVVAPETKALPRDSIEIDYYDCDWNLVAWQFKDCSAHWYYDGDPGYGRYRVTTQEECNGPGMEYTVEQLAGGNTWEPYTGGTSPVCACQFSGLC